jgi:nucleotide-binding universal stress UspA family protein
MRLAREVAARHRTQVARAKRELDSASGPLRRAGWIVRTVVPSGAPLRELLAAARTTRADMVVVGAQGASGLKRMILGSVTEGALNRSRLPVLVVR